MKKKFGKVCYAIGGTLALTFTLGLISGMVLHPYAEVNFVRRSNEPEETASKEETEE